MAYGRVRMRLTSSLVRLLSLAHYLKLVASKYFNFIVIRKNSLEIYLDKSELFCSVELLKSNTYTRLELLNDLVVVDLLSQRNRFKVTYNFTSISRSLRFFVQTFVKESEFLVSLTPVFSSANWAEREAWDLYGVYFINHGDLRRILTDYGFRGFPFRKDFPLTGYVELRYDDRRGDVVYEPVELAQELRFFNFATGWEQD